MKRPIEIAKDIMCEFHAQNVEWNIRNKGKDFIDQDERPYLVDLITTEIADLQARLAKAEELNMVYESAIKNYIEEVTGCTVEYRVAAAISGLNLALAAKTQMKE